MILKSIAGIGSRKTPDNILKEMVIIGKWCRYQKIEVRSGHAEGADWAFELGSQDSCIVFLPWKTFNSKLQSLAKQIVVNNSIELANVAKKYHPNWNALSFGAKKLIARDGCQVLGLNLNSPVDAVVCWTEEAKIIGGTGQALRIAKDYNIEIINMAMEQYNDASKVIEKLRV